jgi:hypothetical protein
MALLLPRHDGALAQRVPDYRRFMPALMTTRNGSAVYFEQQVRVDRTLPFLEAVNKEHPDVEPSLFHVVLWALTKVLDERPRLNRFLAGGRLYQRDGIWISYSIKRALSDDAGLEVIKRRFDPSETFADLVRAVDEGVDTTRQTTTTLEDREVDLLLRVPPSLRRILVGLANILDSYNLLPRAFIDSDAFFASVFVANLGSLHLDAAFHHLYEYGNIPIFCTVGALHDAAVVEDGEVVSRPVATLRFTFDERIEDGLYAARSLQTLCELVEDPGRALS